MHLLIMSSSSFKRASTSMASSTGSPPSTDLYHVRSISLPSRSHPLTVRVERGLHNLKTWAASSLPQAASPTAELLSVGLLALEEMYDCVEELLRLSQTQRALARHHRQKGGAAEELESSVRLLDVCVATRDAVSSLRELARGVQSGLRTRRGLGLRDSSVVQNGIRAFLESRRQAHKESSRCLKTLKQMAAAGNLEYSPLSAADGDLSLALRALKDLKEITVVVFGAISNLFVSKQRRWFRTHRAPLFERELQSAGELEGVEAYLRSIHGRLSGKDAGFEKKAEEAQRRLQRLEVGMLGSLETGLDSMFRRLIQNRVSLLNILNP